MKRKFPAILLLCALFLSLFVGCGEEKSKPAGNLGDVGLTETGGETAPPTLNAELSSTIDVHYKTETFSVPGGATLLSLAPEGNGYIAVTASGSGNLLTLDKSFKVVGIPSDTTGTMLFCPSEKGTAYRLSMEDKEVNGKFETTAVLYQGGEMLYDLPWPNDFTVNAFFLCETPEGLYAASYFYMTLNGKELTLPAVSEEYQPRVCGFLTFDKNHYVVLRELSLTDDGATGKCFLSPLTEDGLGTPLETNLTGMYYTSGKNYCYFIRDNTLYRTDGKVLTACGDLLALGVNVSQIVSIFAEGDSLILALGDRIVRLTETADAEAYETLTIGAHWVSSDFQRLITSFNMHDHGFKVTVKDLPDETALNLAQVSHEIDLITGFGSDILEKRVKNELLLPISDFVDLSPIYPNIVEAGRVNGECYFLPLGFNLFGWELPIEYVPERGYFLDFNEFKEAADSLEKQNFYRSITRHFVFISAASTGFSEWVDYENMTCDFDSESFIGFLKFMKAFAVDQDEADANHQPVLFSPYCQIGMYPFAGQLLGNFEEVAQGLKTPLSGTGALFPVPGEGKQHGSAMEVETLFAIPVGISHEKETRIFLEYLFSEEAQYKMMTPPQPDISLYEVTSLSPRKDVTELRMTELTTQYYENTRKDYMSYGMPDLGWALGELKKNTDATLADTLRYAAAADHYADRWESDVSVIVEEEVENFFKGNITAEKAAEYIQNRVMLMLEEQG